MELILKETISTLGQEGAIVNVKPGYGRNYLLPQGKAVLANAQNKTLLARNLATIKAKLELERQQAENLSKKLAGITITIAQLSGSDSRLFGSVTSTDIHQKLAEMDIVLDKKQIVLADPIKTLGEFQVTIKAGFQLATDITVKIVPTVEKA
ncbi:MAG: 50S ribosomal protein L9 [Desulfobulbaceae bacterium]|jgi:large subunit ribosomal protein L9|nr:50S ribosomal protein L9 [Desulfobulbaceae bacterium]